jgi:hypothetical protein
MGSEMAAITYLNRRVSLLARLRYSLVSYLICSFIKCVGGRGMGSNSTKRLLSGNEADD